MSSPSNPATDAAAALAPMGERARTADNVGALVGQIVQAAQAGDHVVCMSNGSFGGIHAQLLDALSKK